MKPVVDQTPGPLPFSKKIDMMNSNPQDTGQRTALPGASSDLRRMVQFLVLFGIVYGAMIWLFSGTGPIPVLSRFTDSMTRTQASLAAIGLRALGETVSTNGTSLLGKSFACDVNEGCNGMSAVALLVAGVLSFPLPWRFRWIGLAVLIPMVLFVNLVRIAGLFWTGVHFNALFDTVHVYIGQAVVILVSAGLWWIWLSWSFRKLDRSS